MGPKWWYDAQSHMDWHAVAISGVALVIGGGVWLLMHWAEKRWNRDTPKNRRLPR